MLAYTHPTFVKAFCKSIYGIALIILLASCSGGDSLPPTTTQGAPILISVSAQTYTVGQAIAVLSFTNMGSAATNCDVSPNLPAGLSLTVANNTCQITGTPTETDPLDDYIITASNITGSNVSSNAITVAITVSAAVSVSLVSISNARLKGSKARTTPLIEDILTLTFETTGQTNFDPQVSIGGQLAIVTQGDAEGQWVATLMVVRNFESDQQGFDIIIVVPKGVSPTEDLSQAATVMTVQNTPTLLNLVATTAFFLTPILVLETTGYSFAKDQPISPITFTNAGGVVAANGCSVNTPLPRGLNIRVSGTACEITGTPEVVADSGNYIITASNSAGGDMFTIAIVVNKGTDILSFGAVINSAVKLSSDGTMASVDYVANLSFARAATSASATGATTYTSGNTATATVVQGTGEVTIVGAGVAVITAMRASDANYAKATAHYTLNVAKGTDTLTFRQSAVTAIVGDSPSTPQIASGGSGTGSIAYVSSEPDVATVDTNSGEITTVSAGTAMIMATRTEDANYQSVIESYTLTVIAPTLIGTIEELENIRNALNGNYVLTADIDLSSVDNWQPIGDRANNFTGRFNGRGFRISGLNSMGSRYAGLFGYVEGASISNLGVLVGNISTSTISFSGYAGGLVGRASNTSISNSYANIAGNVSASFRAGGLVGYAEANTSISNAYAIVAGDVSAASSISSAGGLVGRASDTSISDSYANVAGDVSSSPSSSSSAGGLVGRASNTSIRDSYANVAGDISSSSSRSFSFVGGLVGYAETNTSIGNSYANVAGNVSSSSRSSSSAGGLVGLASDTSIRDSYANVAGDVSSSSPSSSFAAGLVASANSSPISNAYANVAGDVSSSSRSSSFAAGLVGSASDSPISNAYANVAGSVFATSSSLDSHAGGLVGRVSNASISNTYAIVGDGIFSPSSIPHAGGLVGLAINNSPVSNSYYSDSRQASERAFSNTEGMSKTVAGLKAPTGSSGIYANWTAFYDASESHTLITDTSATFVANDDRRVWYFGDSAQLPSLNPSPTQVSDADLSLYRARQHFVANTSSATQIDLSWSDAGDAYTYYQVYRHTTDDNNEAELASPSVASGRTHADTGLTTGTTYYYWLKACDVSDMCSDFFAHTIEVIPLSPDLANLADTPPFILEQLITAITFGNTSGAVVGCSSNPVLPAGLSLVALGGTCRIVGTPTVVATSREYTVTATNPTGTDMATVTLTVVEPTLIGTMEGLENIRNNLDGHYALTADIDLSSIENWEPIGDELTKFTGSLDGRGFEISGLNSSDYTYAGLFGYVDDASISNLGVLANDISASAFDSYAGGLVGYAENNSRISNSYVIVTGNVSASSHAGGLVGNASNILISNSHADVAGDISVIAFSISFAGGLAGNVSGTSISNSYAKIAGDISAASSTSSSDSFAGGLTGNASRTSISNSYAIVAGNVSAASSSDSYAGGLAGSASRTSISNSYADVAGDVSATAASRSYAGGLVGYATDASIGNVYAVATGGVSASHTSNSSGFSYAGGLVGYAEDTSISNVYAVVTGEVSASHASSPSGFSYAGGLIGYAEGISISNVYAIVVGDVSATSSAGGLVGSTSSSSISNSYAIVTGDISSSSAGGLVGLAQSGSTISNSYYSARRKASEGAFSNTEGMSKTVAELKAPTGLSGSIYANWTAFYDASESHTLITDTSATFDENEDRRVWYFGDEAQLPTLNPSPVAVADTDLPLHRASQHFVATASSATQVDLSWSDVGDDYMYYEVYRHTADDSSGAMRIGVPLAVTVRTYMDMDLTTGTTYYYWLKACPADMTASCSDFFAHTQVTTP